MRPCAYKEMLSRFRATIEPGCRKLVARVLGAKGIILQTRGDVDQAFVVYQELLANSYGRRLRSMKVILY
jgi:hypothetical protein